MELLPGVHRISGTVSNAYLLIDAHDEITVIDVGLGAFERTILHYLRTIGQRPENIRRIILTHRHLDHIGGAAALRTISQAGVWAHPLDVPYIEGRERDPLPSGVLGMLIGTALTAFFRAKPCPVDEELVDGQNIDVGTLGPLQIIHTPGHTHGHCALLLPSRSLFILGDALNNARGSPQVPFNAVNDDPQQARNTAIAMADMSVDNLVFGHGKPILGAGRQALRAAAKKAAHD